MSIPSVIFLDTCIYAGQQYNFQSNALLAFSSLVKEKGIKVLVPRVIDSEVKRQLKVRVNEANRLIVDACRRAPFLPSTELFPIAKVAAFSGAVAELAGVAVWESYLDDLNAIRLGYSEVSLEEIMDSYDRVVPPFREGKKRKEFPDAVALAAVNAYASQNDVIAAVVSEDEDMRLACDLHHSLTHFKSLTAICQILISDDSRLAAIREAVERGRGLIEQSALQEAEGFRFTHRNSTYRILASRIQTVMMESTPILAIGENQCVIQFYGSVEVDHFLKWAEFDANRDDFEEFNGEFLEFTFVEGTAKLALDPTTGEVQAVMSLNFAEYTLEVEEEPQYL